MNKIYLLFITSVILLGNTGAQQTVGLFTNTAESFNGYTLFAPTNGTTIYLINNCGEKVHSWTSQYEPALSCYLMENGTLLRPGKIPGVAGAPRVNEMMDWDGTVIWSYSVAEEFGIQHHDIELLPNGNILLLVSEKKYPPDIEQAGGDASLEELKTEKIIEIQPDLIAGGGTIVWVWNAWDHLIQDRDVSYDNYGVVSQNPERIDINYRYRPNIDWLHVNALDYNAEFDQIMLTVRSFGEIWIIDHSTTTSEAAGSIGGTYQKGGDLLYRWGNPQSYQQGDANDEKLFLPHDGHWIPEALVDEGKILVFNNDAGVLETQKYSSVNIIDPPVDGSGYYSYNYNDGSYDPTDFEWTYKAPAPTDFYSKTFSGAQRLENGNMLICEANSGRFFEINTQKEIVWEYVNPVNGNGPIPQFADVIDNDVFRCIRYAQDYPAFDGKTLTPQGYIEPGSDFECNLFTGGSYPAETRSHPASIYPNPANNMLYINGYYDSGKDLKIECLSVTGQSFLLTDYELNDNFIMVDVTDLESGFYIIKISDDSEIRTAKFIISK